MKFLIILFAAFLMAGCASTTSPMPSYRSSTIMKPDESQEFADLMELDKKDRLQRAAESVDLLVNDASAHKVSVLIRNETACNIIVRVSGGSKQYNLPIPKNDKNFLVLEKGNYIFKANFCDSKYYSEKNLTESITLTLTEKYR